LTKYKGFDILIKQSNQRGNMELQVNDRVTFVSGKTAIVKSFSARNVVFDTFTMPKRNIIGTVVKVESGYELIANELFQ